ncbi:MAG: FAD binding domain-containing protein [Thermoflexales bacterium]|nr:FAD binding domain-containing protein [Thermoflexales bacterium]
MSQFTYARAHSVDEALALLSDTREKSTPLAGGTDLLVNLRKMPPSFTRVVDVRRVPEMRQIKLQDGHIVIGAAVSYTQVSESALLEQHATCLAQAARTVGGPAIANMGTLGGNVASAASWADAVPPLICLDAQAYVCSAAGARTVPVAHLIAAPHRTHLQPDELIAHFVLPVPHPETRTVFLKLGRRNAQTLSRVNLAAALRQDEAGRITFARLVVGAVVPIAQRFESVEALLLNQVPSSELMTTAAEHAARELMQRVGKHWAIEYDMRALKALVLRALRALVNTSAPNSA